MIVARRAAGWLLGLALVAGVSTLTGCADAERAQVQGLQMDNQRLARRNAELEAENKRLAAERDQAMQRERSLAEQLRQAQIAMNGPAKTEGPWSFSGQFAWQDLQEAALFDSGKAVLKPGAHDRLRKIADDIRTKFPDKAVFVIGHTDTDPIMKTKQQWIDNLDLSINRGATVTRELYTLGLPKARLIAAGAGEYFPKVDNTTSANKQMNRRVQILLVPPPPMSPSSGEEHGGTRERETPPPRTSGAPEEG